MATRCECIEMAKNDIVKELLEGIEYRMIDLGVIEELRIIMGMKEEQKDEPSRMMTCEELDGTGIGWIENSFYDEDEEEMKEPETDIAPCVWSHGYIYDGESEPWEMQDELGESDYNRMGTGFRIWSDGRMPTELQRKTMKWEGR